MAFAVTMPPSSTVAVPLLKMEMPYLALLEMTPSTSTEPPDKNTPSRAFDLTTPAPAINAFPPLKTWTPSGELPSIVAATTALFAYLACEIARAHRVLAEMVARMDAEIAAGGGLHIEHAEVEALRDPRESEKRTPGGHGVGPLA